MLKARIFFPPASLALVDDPITALSPNVRTTCVMVECLYTQCSIDSLNFAGHFKPLSLRPGQLKELQGQITQKL